MSHLSDIAATLAPGRAAKLTVAGYNATFTNGGVGIPDNAMGFASKANYSWESGGRVYFFGGPHVYNDLTNRSKIWYYDIPTNVAEQWDRPTAYPHCRCSNVSCPSTGNTVTLSAPFAASAGQQVYVRSGTNFVPDAFYVISGVVDSTHLLLSGDPRVTPGVAASNGVLYINGRYLHMVQWNTIDPARRQLLQPVMGNGVYALNLDQANPSDILRSEFTVLDTDTAHIGFTLSGAFELFPERNEFCHWRPADKIEHFNRNTLTWGATDTVDLTGANLGMGSVYSSRYKCMIFYGGYAATISNFKVQRLNLDGTYTRLTDAPEFFHAAHDTLAAEDPVSGDIVFFNDTGTELHVFTLNPSTGAWTTRGDIATNFPSGIGYGANATSLYGCVICSMPDRGVLFIFGDHDIWIYKHTTNTWATTGPPKQSMPGNTSFYGFENFDRDFKRANWDTANSALNTQMLSRGHVLTPRTSTTIFSVEGRVDLDGHFLIPTQDTTTYYAAGGGTASLRIDNKSRSSQDQKSEWKGPVFQGDETSPYRFISPQSPNGNILYGQFRYRVDAAMMTPMRQTWTWFQSPGLSTSAANSTIVTAPAAVPFYPEAKDRSLWLHGLPGWVEGFYTIVAVGTGAAPLTATLDRSPTPTAAASGGQGYLSPPSYVNMWRGTLKTYGAGNDYVEFPAGQTLGVDPILVGTGSPTYLKTGQYGPISNPPWVNGTFPIIEYIDNRHVRLSGSPTGGVAGLNGWGQIPATVGYKVLLNIGNQFDSDSSGSLEITIQEQDGSGYLLMYGQGGGDPYGANRTVPLIPDTWHEITYRIEVRGVSNDTTSRVTFWIDGVQCLNYENARINWLLNNVSHAKPGDGIGQINCMTFMTRKAPDQVYPDGHAWYDDLILSTQPIPFGAGAAAEPPPITTPAMPCLPWTLRS